MARIIKKIVSITLHLLMMHIVYNVFIPENSLFKKDAFFLKKQENIVNYENTLSQSMNKKRDVGYHLLDGLPADEGIIRFACQRCHKDYPHKKDNETRAFYNMHSFKISCLACHIDANDKEKVKYGWFDAKGGFKSSDIKDAKIAPYVIIDSFEIPVENEIKDHNDLAVKFKINIAKKTDLKCNNCHTPKGILFFDMPALGYNEDIINKLRNLDEAELYNRQEKWIYPDFL